MTMPMIIIAAIGRHERRASMVVSVEAAKGWGPVGISGVGL